MIAQLQTAFRFVRANSWPVVWRAFARRDAHPFLQFMKYGFSGVIAAIAHNGAVAILAATVLPAGKGMIVDGQVLSEEARTWNLLMANTLAWPIGTLTAYLLNTTFVFTPGRHSKAVEAGLFFAVGAISFFPGIFVVKWLAGHLHLPSTIAQIGFVITSVMVNFLCRKFIIFKG